MTGARTARVTALLRAWRDGDDGALQNLLPIVEAELRRIARVHMRRERRGHTLQPTALVNEVFLRLVTHERSRGPTARIYSLSARLMRRVLVDHARARGYQKRGGEAQRVTLDDGIAATQARSVDLIALDRALTGLAEMDERRSRVVELRYFGGLTVEETAAALDVCEDTVKRDWRLAKLWLLKRC